MLIQESQEKGVIIDSYIRECPLCFMKRISLKEDRVANFDEIIRLFSQPSYKSEYSYAKATETCIKCKRPVGVFRDPASRFEYGISALCQECQDQYFLDHTQDIDGKQSLCWRSDN